MTTQLIERRNRAVPRCWRRGLNALHYPQPARAPEPAQLYGLITLTLVQHAPHPATGHCNTCGAAWPCEPVRLAYRLREGF